MGKVKKIPIWFIVTFFSLGGFICGYILSVIAGAAPFIKQDFSLSTYQLSTLMGLILLGGIIAKAVFLFADKIGRKNLIFATLILYTSGILIFTLGNSYTMLYIGRLMQGGAVILGSVSFTVYLSEISPPDIRGRMVTLFQLAWTGGMFSANLIDFVIVKTGNWQLVFNIMLVFPVLMFFAAFFLPESPRLLAMNGKKEKAKNILKMLLTKATDEEIEREIEELSEVKKSEGFKETLSLIFSRKYGKSIFMAVTVFVLTQLTGINAIVQTSVIMLKDCGMKSEIMSMAGGSLVTGINFLATILTIILVDKIGRKKLLKLGTGGFFTTALILALMLYLLPVGNFKGWVMLFGLFICVAFVAVGPCGVVYVVLTEVLPTRVRSIGIVIGGFIAVVVGYFFVSKFLIVAKLYGYSSLFLMIAFFGALYFVFATFILPETKGKTLEEIEAEL